MDGRNGGNGVGEEVPRPRMWYELGHNLNVPLSLLEKINRQRADYHNPEYWRRVRQQQREAMRREAEEAAAVEVVAENEKDDEKGDLEVDPIQIDGSSRGGTSDSKGTEDESQVNDGGEGIGTENESVETLKTEEVLGGDAGTEDPSGRDEVQDGAVIFDQEVLKGMIEDEGDHVEHGAFEEESEGKKDVNIRSKPPQLVTQDGKNDHDDKDESQIDNNKNVEHPAPPKKKRRHPVIIPPHVTVIPGQPTKYHCNLCLKTFKTKYHVKVHSFCDQTIPKPFQCPDCDQGFASNRQYQNHLLQHTNQHNFDCDHCGKVFGHKSTRDEHVRFVHLNERPHACELCTRSFISGKDLRRHLVTHTDERPLKCRICGTGFNRKDNLERHIRNVHGVAKEDVADQIAIEALSSTGKDGE